MYSFYALLWSTVQEDPMITKQDAHVEPLKTLACTLLHPVELTVQSCTMTLRIQHSLHLPCVDVV